ncbi:DUF5666 domain-containing protein [Dokdonella immobilis]|uniref:DUF5666 domain-containing protein n=1 Tax=Dokdonella immobilis TaxID=578942 RepID=A0A1I4YUX2_9GAMM|nr:DUF5666 domain-containing protein [Dokdonella immobilis]SFN41430.1 hypothetical protein SAMN05216289_12011 [Dokdonella immobilis]
MYTKTLLSLAVTSMLAIPAMAKDPYSKPNNSWITLSGTVESVSPDRFMLDYGDGMITVEMDSPGGREGGYKLVKGDKVSVSGAIDDDLFERTTIEASSVYVESLGTNFYANAVDDEDPMLVSISTPLAVSKTVVAGKVTSVDGREFTVDAGPTKITVDTSGMAYNPMDDKGFQKIEKGQRVSVAGTLDHDFFSGRELMASTIITLSPMVGS